MTTQTEDILSAETRTRLQAMAYLKKTSGDESELKLLRFKVQEEVSQLVQLFCEAGLMKVYLYPDEVSEATASQRSEGKDHFGFELAGVHINQGIGFKLGECVEAYPQAIMDWGLLARENANFVGDIRFETHRSVVDHEVNGQTVTMIFGNDGYSEDKRSQAEVVALRACLKERGIEELGFGTSDNGYSWLLIAKTSDDDDQNEFGRVIRQAWMNSGSKTNL